MYLRYTSAGMPRLCASVYRWYTGYPPHGRDPPPLAGCSLGIPTHGRWDGYTHPVGGVGVDSPAVGALKPQRDVHPRYGA